MLILVNVAFQTGFCAFVLSNYMKTLPKELYEAAMVDGASVWRQYWQLTLPLCRPPLAALATLEVTWIYNEFFWATVLMRTGDKFPITSALNALKGQFFTDLNLLAAGSIIVALPTLVIFFALQKQFVSGLTLGANKVDRHDFSSGAAAGRRCRRPALGTRRFDRRCGAGAGRCTGGPIPASSRTTTSSGSSTTSAAWPWVTARTTTPGR